MQVLISAHFWLSSAEGGYCHCIKRVLCAALVGLLAENVNILHAVFDFFLYRVCYRSELP